LKRTLLLLPLVALAGALGITGIASAAPAPPPQTLNVQVGNVASGVAANDFFPDQIQVHKGDTIHFANTSVEPHTVTYLPGTPQPMDRPALIISNPAGPGKVINPLAFDPTNTSTSPNDFDPHKYFNSGWLGEDASVDVAFNVAGDFKFLCLVHPGMELAISVAGQPIDVQSQADLDKAAKAQSDALIATGKAIIAGYQLTKTTDTSGAANWNAQVGGGVGQADLLSFLPGTIQIATGDTVTWTATAGTPHSVTFGTEPDLLTQISNPNGGPKLNALAPGAVFPAGGNTFSGGNVHSGLLDNSGALPAGKSFSLKFTKAGSYTYNCIVHEGMTGTVVVSDKAPAPAPKPIAPPDTGSGPMPTAGNGAWMISMAILGIAGAAFVLAGAKATSKRDA
jgi:plastocyanin